MQQQGNRGQAAPGVAPPSKKETLRIRPQQAPAVKRHQKAAQQVIWVEQILLEGNRLLPSGTTESLLAEYSQREQTIDRLIELTQRLEALHLEAGFLVRVRLPQQSMSQGVLELAVEEIVFGGVRIENAGRRVSNQLIENIVYSRQTNGGVVSLKALESAVFAINELPGIQTQASVFSDPKVNRPELLLKISDKPSLSGSAGFDNFGSRATGTDRLQANLSLASPFGRSEILRLSGFKTEGSGLVRAGASIPVGSRGLTLGGNVSRLDYRLTQEAFRDLNIRGDATLYGLEATYPLVQRSEALMQVSVSSEQRNFNNLANMQTISQYSVRATTALINGLLRHGTDSYSTALLAATAGRVDLDGSPNQGSDSEFANTQGTYRKLRAGASHVRSLDAQWTAQMSAQLQTANRNLDASERFILGGPQGVRAYPVGEGPGSRARLIQLELRRSLILGADGSLLADWGQVETFADNSRNLTPVNRYILKSVGLQVSYVGRVANQWDAQIRLIAARASGDHPNPGPGGANQDGSTRRSRLWLDASILF